MSSQVQGTNDSSIVSKYSMVQRGYFEDCYIRNFVDKPSRRSPLINAGYWVRASVISSVISEFVQTKGTKNIVQVVSFGAGFDTSFFRLNDLEGVRLIYYEIDLPVVVKRKLEFITRSPDLIGKLRNLVVTGDGTLRSSNYHLLVSDLRSTPNTEKCLTDAGFKFTHPTLFLSECSITYMDESSSTNLINWAGKVTKDAVFVTYEQIMPYDGFGVTMLKHFNSLQTPLLSVLKYPTLEDHQRRYIEQSWEKCDATAVWNAFTRITTTEQRFSLLSLEPFDEWEEWHLKCNHYVLAVARKGQLCKWLPKALPTIYTKLGMENQRKIYWCLHFKPNLQRYGHTAVLFGKDENVLVVGGFGKLQKDDSHRRLQTISCFSCKYLSNNVKSRESMWETCYSGDEVSLDCMYHTCTVLYRKHSEECNEVAVILYGGRTSPMKCVNQIPLLLVCTVLNETSLVTKCQQLMCETSDGPEPRWRHSACLIANGDCKIYSIFGGCSTKLKVFDDLWVLKISELKQEQRWCQIKNDVSPCARFSHACTTLSEKMFISGGIDRNLQLLSDLWMWDSKSCTWTELKVQGMIPRYGHTCTAVGDTLLLVGGVTTVSETIPGVAAIQLSSLTCREYHLPALDPAAPIMLHNHTTVLSENMEALLNFGGGGNCFSFGTAFNSHIVEIPLQQFNLNSM